MKTSFFLVAFHNIRLTVTKRIRANREYCIGKQSGIVDPYKKIVFRKAGVTPCLLAIGGWLCYEKVL